MQKNRVLEQIERLARPAALIALLLDIVVVLLLAWFGAHVLPVAVDGGLALLLLVAQAGALSLAAPGRQDAGGHARDGLVVHVRSHSDRVRRAVMYDEQSGLCQRWYFEMRLLEEAARCRRYDLSMAVVVINVGKVDLPTLSTGAWQDIAARTASITGAAVRSVDLVGTLGPLAFALCLIHCDRNGAEKAMMRILEELKDYDCSAGLAVYPGDGCEAAALIELARSRPQMVRQGARQRSA